MNIIIIIFFAICNGVLKCDIVYQVQDCYALDLFLFAPRCPMKSTSELPLIEMLVTGRKEKYLIHPVIEIFLKLKWKKTWKLYTFLVSIITIFYIFLCGFALTYDVSDEKLEKEDSIAVVWW